MIGVIKFKSDNVVVELDGNVIAFAKFNKRACIEDIFVEEKFRQNGLAKRMIKEIENRTGLIVTPLPPVSDLGKYLFK